MDQAFGRRCGEIRVTWGTLGPGTLVARWARELGRSEHAVRNVEKGYRPRGGADTLEDLYEALRAKGADTSRLARWALLAEGEMPKPSGANVPNVSAPAPASPVTVEGREHLPVDPERALRRALEAGERGEDPLPVIKWALDKIDSARAVLREAKAKGLASVGIGLVVLAGGSPSSQRSPAALAPSAFGSCSSGDRRRARGVKPGAGIVA